jgi:hypothetical protein
MLKITMKHITPFMLFWAIALLNWGCRKDVEEIRQYPVTMTELSLFLKQVPDATTVNTFHFNGLNEDKIITTPNSVRVFLTDVNQLFADKASHAPVAASACSDLKIVVTIAATKGDMLSRELPTTSTEDMLLESGGMVQVQAFCGTTELELLPGRTIKVQLPAADVKDNMFVYNAVYKDDFFAGWGDTGQEVFNADWPAVGGGTVEGYELIVSNLGWSNCARLLTTAAVTPFCISLKPSYTGLNTQAYLVFENTQVVAPLKFDDASHSFCFPNIPAGYPVRVVTIANMDAAYWLGSTTTETGTNSMLPLQPQQKAAVDVLNFLRTL